MATVRVSPDRFAAIQTAVTGAAVLVLVFLVEEVGLTTLLAVVALIGGSLVRAIFDYGLSPSPRKPVANIGPAGWEAFIVPIVEVLAIVGVAWHLGANAGIGIAAVLAGYEAMGLKPVAKGWLVLTRRSHATGP